MSEAVEVDDGEPTTFLEFAEALGVRFEAGQRAFCAVAFDGIQPRDLPEEDRKWARKVFGEVDEVPPDALDSIGIVCGGRSGKTYLCSLRLLHLSLIVDLSVLAPGEQAFAAIIAPRLEEARQGLRYAAGAARLHPEIASLIVSDTTDQLVLRRDDGEMVAIKTIAAGAGGIGGRGKTLIGLLLDETCFFRDKASGVVNDQVVYDAAEPRVMEGGQTMVASTPWVARGLLHSMWKANWEKPVDHLIAHASTVNFRTNARQLKKVEKAYRKNPVNAAIEFGAEWGSTTVELFFTDAELAAFFDPSTPELGRAPQVGERVSFGGDLGFVRNSSTLAGVHELPDGTVLLAHLEEHQPPAGGRLKPSVVCKGFARVIAGQGAAGMVADQHERASLDEHLSDAGLAVFPAPSASDALIALRAGIREGLVRCPSPPADDEAPTLVSRLRQQMVDTKQKRTVGDKVVAVLPDGLDGSHGDVLVAVAQAVWGLGRWGGAEVRAAKKAPAIDDVEARKAALRQPPQQGKHWLSRRLGR